MPIMPTLMRWLGAGFRRPRPRPAQSSASRQTAPTVAVPFRKRRRDIRLDILNLLCHGARCETTDLEPMIEQGETKLNHPTKDDPKKKPQADHPHVMGMRKHFRPALREPVLQRIAEVAKYDSRRFGRREVRRRILVQQADDAVAAKRGPESQRP